MQSDTKLKGVFAAGLTPLRPDLSIDQPALVAHCRWLIERGCHGVALFGTTGEGTSFSAAERKTALEATIAAGIPAAVLVPGTGCSSLPDTVELTSHAVKQGCPGVLTLPPFYWKNVGDDGLFRYFSELVERVGDARLRLYLYHIPQLSAVGFSLKLIERLLKAYPAAIAGIKDSSAKWDNTKAILENFPGFGTFTGWDPHLRDLLRLGGAGTISGMPNVNPTGLRQLYESWSKPEGDALHEMATKLITLVDATPPTAGLRAVLAHFTGKDSWLTRRPPLMPIAREQHDALIAAVAATGFTLPPPV
ncbi:MAG: dihydrodipicolinate synthase family protein [Alphaproteobacteria bacterium]|nr:dihydrodipicolinate synthase family protein [Alphaproteobacteria bacterium]